MRMFRTCLLLWMISISGSVSADEASTIRNRSLSNVHFRHASRFKRNAPPTNLQQFVDHASIIARISNGIALQSGLMDGSIKIEDAVGELLNFGSVKVSDVASFKSDSVSSLTQKLKGLPNTLDSSVKNLEEGAKKLDGLRASSETVGDVTKMLNTQPYFDSLKSYENDFKFETFSEAHTSLSDLLKTLEEIEQSKVNEGSLPKDKKALITTKFISLPSRIETVAEKLGEVKDAAENLTSHMVLVESSSTFAPLGKMIDLIKTRLGLTVRSNARTVEIVRNNFQQITDLSGLFNRANTDLIRLSDLMKSRTSAHQKKLTSGFPRGVSDLKQLEKDVQDPWIQTISNNSISSERLAEGLKPLLNTKESLAEIDGKLNPGVSSFEAFTSLEKLQRDTSTAPLDSYTYAGVFNEIGKCMIKAPQIHEQDFALSQTVVRDIELMGKAFSGLNDAVQKIDVDKNKKAMEDFLKFLDFTNINDVDGSVKEVPAVMDRIRSSNNLKQLKELISGLAQGINIDKQSLNSTAGKIIKEEDVLIFPGLTEEVGFHTCLQDLKENLAKLLKVIKVIQTLRDVNVAKIQEVEKVSTAVSSVVENLKTVNKITDDMNKAALPISKELNSMNDSKTTSEAISQSVNLLRSANELKKLETSISKLKNVEKLVAGSIKSIKDANQKKKVGGQWGDNTAHMTSLETAMKSVDDVEKSLKLEDLKTFESYGNQMSTSLLALKDVKINLKDKMNALDTVIPLVKDPKEVADLKDTKDTLRKLDSLDLSFASYHSISQKVPAAFQSLHDFLSGFSMVPAPPTQDVPAGQQGGGNYSADGSSGSKDKEKSPDVGLILGASGGTILVFGGIAVASFFIFKHSRHRVDKESLKAWIREQQFEKHEDAYRFHESLQRTAVILVDKFQFNHEQESLKYLPKSKHRTPGDKDHPGKWCNPDTALKHLKKDGKLMPIHANIIKSANGKVFYATQAPLTANPNAKHPTEDTKEDFWHMCVHDKVQKIVMLCAIREIGGLKAAYFPLELNGTMTCGRYELKTISYEKAFGEIKDVEVRKIQVKDTTRRFGGKRIITHYNYLGWPDQKVPIQGNMETPYALMKEMEKSNKPVVVHCVSGIGRTMAFIGVHVISENVKLDGDATMGDELTKLKKSRLEAVQTIRQSYWLQLAVAYKLDKDYKLGMKDHFEPMMKMFKELAFKDMGLPEEILNERKAIRELREATRAAGKEFDIVKTTQKIDKDHLGRVILF